MVRFCTVKCSTVQCTQESRTNYRYHPIVNCVSVCYAFFTILLSFFALSVNALIIHRTHSCVRVKLKTYAWMADSLAGWLVGWLIVWKRQTIIHKPKWHHRCVRMARLLRVHCSCYKGCEFHCQFTVPHWNRTDW